MTSAAFLPRAITGPVNKYTRSMDPFDNVAVSTNWTKPPACQMPFTENSQTVSGPNPGYSVAHRTSTIQPGGSSIANHSHLPEEVHWDRFNNQLEVPSAAIASINGMSRDDFHQYRDQKDRDPNRVPRAPNTLQSNYCTTCAFPPANMYGCSKDSFYYTQHPEYRDIYTFPCPQKPGWYGYPHEQLDRHNTGHFWKSNRV